MHFPLVAVLETRTWVQRQGRLLGVKTHPAGGAIVQSERNALPVKWYVDKCSIDIRGNGFSFYNWKTLMYRHDDSEKFNKAS